MTNVAFIIVLLVVVVGICLRVGIHYIAFIVYKKIGQWTCGKHDYEIRGTVMSGKYKDPNGRVVSYRKVCKKCGKTKDVYY